MNAENERIEQLTRERDAAIRESRLAKTYAEQLADWQVATGSTTPASVVDRLNHLDKRVAELTAERDTLNRTLSDLADSCCAEISALRAKADRHATIARELREYVDQMDEE